MSDFLATGGCMTTACLHGKHHGKMTNKNVSTIIDEIQIIKNICQTTLQDIQHRLPGIKPSVKADAQSNDHLQNTLVHYESLFGPFELFY